MSGDSIIEPALQRIEEIIGDRLTLNESLREQHGHDESWHPAALPDAVCFVEDIHEISRILAVCSEHRVPVIPFGAGTGVAGQVNATSGGISLDVSRMDEILSVNQEDFDCVVQAGVTRDQLNQYLRDTGLFFSVDPGADATLGGMAATRASGTYAVRYGTMRENVVALKAVLADGTIVETGGRSRKSAAGYDLCHLFVGSEGTLGVIVELTLRLHPQPTASSSAAVQFKSIDSAVDSVVEGLLYGIPFARIELVDETLIRAMNSYSKTDFPEFSSLFVEFHGTETAVEEHARLFEEVCKSRDCKGFTWSADAAEQRKMWKARHDAAWAFRALKSNTGCLSTDVCVPLSRLSECIRQTKQDLDRNINLITNISGHVGDGNFHVVILADPNDPDERSQVDAFYDRLVSRALSMGGTCTGEHGVGLQKLKYLTQEFGAGGIKLMQTLKNAVDPRGIMNPGKKIPRVEG